MTLLFVGHKMKSEWDEQKRSINLRRHEIDFADAERIFENDLFTSVDDRFDYGEPRLVSFGLFDGEIVAVAYPAK